MTLGCEGSRHARGSPSTDDFALRWLREVDSRVYAIARGYSRSPYFPGDLIIVFASAHALVLAEEGVTVFLFPCGDVEQVIDRGLPLVLPPKSP